jgi:leader peptidase (prepilin peptidase)/N-methyltransferase
MVAAAGAVDPAAIAARLAPVAVAVAAGAGALAGGAARVVLARLRMPVRLPPGVCEVAVAALWALLAWRPLPWWWLPVPAGLAWLAVVLTATDLRHRLLPDAVVLPAYPVAAALLAVAAIAGPGPGAAVRAAAAAGLLLVVHAAVHLAAPGQLGAGDVKLAGLVGGTLGAVSWPAVLLGPLVAAAVTAILALLAGSRGAPHGPGLLAAALLVAMFPAAGTPAG